MFPRLSDLHTLAPDAIKGMLALEAILRNTGLEPELVELVKIRASQINGCAFCLHMHVVEARAHGISEMRIHLLTGWRESSLYSERERAALAWTESLTRLTETGAPDADYEQIERAFTPAERVHLTLMIGMINNWNRLNVGFRTPAMDELHAA